MAPEGKAADRREASGLILHVYMDILAFNLHIGDFGGIFAVTDAINTAFELLRMFLLLLRTRCMSGMAKDIEILALRSQLSILEQQLVNKKIPRAKVSPGFRLLWVFLSKHFHSWKSHLVIVKPETVIKWHRKAFKLYWKRKSKPGRRCISNQTIVFMII